MDTKTIRYWDGNNGPYEVEVVEASIDAFRETHPGCVVVGVDDGEDETSAEEPPAVEVLPDEGEPVDDAARQATPSDVAAVYSTYTPA